MADIDQRPGTDSRRADGRSGIHTGFSLGRTALTGWALTAVLGLAAFGTALGATPVLAADTTPLGGFGTVARGSAPAVDPRTVLTVGQVVNPVAVAGPVVPVLPMDTVTAVSVPTPAAGAPSGTVAAPGAGTPNLAVGGTPPATGTPVPAGPAAQLRQAAFTSAAPDQRAALAIRTALAQIGLPYVWGGDGPTNGDAGFDCSGLTTFSYGTAGVLLPRTAHTQYNSGPHVPDGVALQPGDLVFYGTSARVHHVGMYLGAGRMVNAPTFGKPVQVAFYRYRGDDYLGATRPAAAGGSLTTGVLPYVEPLPAVPDVALAPAQRQQQAQERVFQAPTASLPAVLPQPGDVTLPPEQQSAAQSIAESDAVAPARVVAPQPVPAPVAVDPPAQPGRGSAPVAGTTTASSAPITPSPTAPAAVATSPGTSTSTPAPSNPAGSTTSGTTTTAAPAAPPAGSSTPAPVTPAPATSSPTPVVVDKASGSTTATTTLAPTSSVRTTTPKATTSKVATPVAPKTAATTSAVKTVTSPTTAAKAVTTTSKPAAKTEDDDPTATRTSASTTKASKTKTTEEKSSATKTSATKTSAKKTAEEKASSSDEGDD